MTAMSYDIFISYCHPDLVWAERFERALLRLGLSVFRDSTEIRAGQEWPSALREALDQSRALLLLWSEDHAAASSWVHFEAARFEVRQTPGVKLQVCLKGSYPPYSESQTIPDLSIAGAYANGAIDVDPNIWAKVLQKIEDSIGHEDPVPIVHQVILASTHDRMKTLVGSSATGKDAECLQSIVDRLELRDQLLDRYGDQSSDWKPFSGDLSIQTILQDLRAAMIDRGAARFRWRPADDLFSASTTDRERYAENLYDQPCVIVLDAVSLFDREIRSLSEIVLDECLSNELAAVMILPPTHFAERDFLRDNLEGVAGKLFKQLYREFREAKLPKAQCNFLTPDDREISRLLAAVVRSSTKHRSLRLQ
jgi:hypothetical protein